MKCKIKQILIARCAVALLACLLISGEVTPMTSPATASAHLDCCSIVQDQQTVSPATPDSEAKTQHATSQPTAEPALEVPAKATSQPTTPEGVSVRGVVTVSGRLDLQKPDLTRVVVYLASDPQLDGGAEVDHVTVAQKNKSFIPNFTVIPLGTTVEFPNWDDFDHNVFSRSKAAPAFDLDRYPRGQSKSRVFEKVGIVQIFCNIHPQMRAMVFVTPNRYFARADAEGRFELKSVPPGKYEIVVWQERCSEQRQTIEVGSQETPDLSFALDENRQSIIANDPPRKDSGYGVERGLGVKREKLNLPIVKDAHPAPDAPPQ